MDVRMGALAGVEGGCKSRIGPFSLAAAVFASNLALLGVKKAGPSRLMNDDWPKIVGTRVTFGEAGTCGLASSSLSGNGSASLSFSSSRDGSSKESFSGTLSRSWDMSASYAAASSARRTGSITDTLVGTHSDTARRQF